MVKIYKMLVQGLITLFIDVQIAVPDAIKIESQQPEGLIYGFAGELQ